MHLLKFPNTSTMIFTLPCLGISRCHNDIPLQPKKVPSDTFTLLQESLCVGVLENSLKVVLQISETNRGRDYFL